MRPNGVSRSFGNFGEITNKVSSQQHRSKNLPREEQSAGTKTSQEEKKKKRKYSAKELRRNEKGKTNDCKEQLAAKFLPEGNLRSQPEVQAIGI